jgi:Zn finger protein HypA/HybF involved in hydrogenase expression
MPKTGKELAMHDWTDDEIEDLLRAAVMEDEDAWCYCAECGTEISPVEPDAAWSWCSACHSKVKVDGLRSLGLI